MLKRIRQMLEERLDAADVADIANDETVSSRVQTAAAALLVELIKSDRDTDEQEWQTLELLLSNSFQLDRKALQVDDQ